MSYQTSIHFNPTALLTIKTEVDNSIKQVESAVAALVEEQQLPFGIDDALLQLKQCAKILYLIDKPMLAKIAEYSAELMQKIMQDPQNIKTKDVINLSQGTVTLKRYIEFSCLKEVTIPQLLLESLNGLELSLKKPLTREGDQIKPFLECVSPQLNLGDQQQVEHSDYVHKLYKICLQHLLSTKEISEGFAAAGLHLSAMASNTPSQQYWQLVSVVLNQLQNIDLTAPRLRVLIQVESLIGAFVASPQTFNNSLSDLSDILSLCVIQENNLAEQIREKLNLGDDLLSDTQLHLFKAQLASPDYETVKTVTHLTIDDINSLHKEIELNYNTLSNERAIEIKNQLISTTHVLNLLNLHEMATPIFNSANQIDSANTLKNEEFAHEVSNQLLVALNQLELYSRQNTSSYLQYPVINKNIALDRLDNSYQTLMTELKALIELSTSTLTSYSESEDLTILENLPSQFKEMSGAIYFFIDSYPAQQAFSQCASYITSQIENQKHLTKSDIQNILNVCASADILIESVRNHQPIMFNMFDVALQSSQQLKSVA